MIDLKPCPFCGYETPKITKKRSGSYRRVGDYIQVLCAKCKARGPIFEGLYDDVVDAEGHILYSRANPAVVAQTEQIAAEAWNRRAAGREDDMSADT